jgi:hypothetical protein
LKRRDRERHLREHGVQLMREGGNHSVWGLDAERSTSLPGCAKSRSGWRRTCRDLGIPPPSGPR